MLVLPFLRYPFDKIILYIGLTDWSSALSHLKIALHSYHCQETQCIIDIRVKFLSFSAPTFENSSRNKTMLHSLKCLKCWSHSTFFIKIRKLFNFFYSVATIKLKGNMGIHSNFFFFDVDHFQNLYWICYNTASVLWCLFVCLFWPWGMWDLSSTTKDWTCTPCIGRWSLNHWTAGKSP